MIVVTDLPQVILYRTKGCERCLKAVEVLREVLDDLGYEFDSVVSVRFVEDISAVKELREKGIVSAPTIRIGDRFLVEDDPTNYDAVRLFLEKEPFFSR